MPAAATLGHFHTCPKVNPGPVPHVGGPVAMGSPNVLICGMPAARVGDMAICVGPPDKIAKGSSSVIINNKPAARMGDRTAHGGIIISGMPNVLIGDNPGSVTLSSPPANLTPPEPVSASMAASASASAAQMRRASVSQNIGTGKPDLVDKAIKNTNSKQYNNAVSEAVGELGMEEYKQRSGIQDDPRFIKRYHGPDDLAKDANGKTVGLEAKGRADGQVSLNQHKGGRKQLSKKANLVRAKKMLDKQRQGKIGKESKRIGGPYTEQEIELYQDVFDNDGDKGLISTHTNSNTGEVKVVKADAKGKPVSKETFQIENYTEKKQKIMKLLRHLL